jgi:O-antigen ligase
MRELLEPTRIILGAFFLVFLLDASLKRNSVVPLDRTERLMGIFSLLLVTNVLLLSERPLFSMHVVLDAFIVPFLAYYVTRRLVTNEERFCRLVQLLSYLGLFIIICCLIERLSTASILYRLSGPFENVTNLHSVLTVILYAALAGTQATTSNLRRFLLLLIPVVILLTLSRGFWVGSLAGIWVFLFLGRRLINPSKKLGTIGVALIGIPLLAIAIQVFIPLLIPTDRLEKRVADVKTVDFRFKRWTVALQEGVKSPIFGIGLNNTRELFGHVLNSYFSPHNSFVTLFAELGTIGSLVYLAIVGSIVRMGLRLYQKGIHPRDRWRGVAVLAVIVAYQVSAVFINVLFTYGLGNVYIYVFMGGMAGLYGRYRAHSTSGNKMPEYDPSLLASRRLPRSVA